MVARGAKGERWWQTLRGIVDARVARLGFLVFGTSVPVRVNLIHILNHLLVRAAFLLAGGWYRAWPHRAEARRFHRDGFVAFSPALPRPWLEMFARRIDGLFAIPGNTFGTKGYDTTAGLIGRVSDFPELASLLTQEIIRTVEACFSSYFKTCSVNIYRIMPTPRPEDSSFLWHFDKSPRQMVKLMIYLDDSTGETGAFRLKPKPLSYKLKRAGFWDRWKAEPFREVLNEGASTRVFEGPMGTAVLFSAGECIHKATSPLHGHRDVVTFTLHPSLWPWRTHFAAISATKELSENYSSCARPFSD